MAFRREEQRQQHRFRVSSGDARGRLFVSTVDVPVSLTNLSLTGAALRVPNLRLDRRPGSFVLDLHLAGEHLGETSLELIHVGALGGQPPTAPLLGVRFREHSEAFLQGLCRYLVHQSSQTVERPHFVAELGSYAWDTEPARIHQLLARCCRTSTPLQVVGVDGRRGGRLTPMKLDSGLLSGRFLAARDAGPISSQPCHLTLTSPLGLYVFPSRFLGRSPGGEAVFEQPVCLLHGGARRLQRVDLSDGEVRLEFLHPQLPGKLVSKHVKEVGLAGLSFELDVDHDLLVKGTRLESAILRLPTGQSIPSRCVVRHTVQRPRGGFTCGIELQDFTGQGRRVWVDFVLERLNPNVLDTSPAHLTQVWDLFDQSGYLAEKPRERMQSMRAPFFSVWRQLLATREHARCWMYVDREQPVGTICTSRIYSSTWLNHQLAADLDRFHDKPSKLLVLADLVPNTLLQWFGGLHPDSNVVGYWDADKPFNRWAWFDFFDTQRDKGRLAVQRLHVTDFGLDRLPACGPVGDIHCRPATAEELPLLSADLRDRDGPFVYEAFDYAPERILLDELGHRSGTQLGRRRELIVAEIEDDLIGFALLEIGAAGLNIFSLYDTCRIVVREPLPHSRCMQVRDALFHEAVQHFRSQDRHCFTYLAGEGDAAAPEQSRYFTAKAVRAVIGGCHFSQMARFLHEQWTLR